MGDRRFRASVIGLGTVGAALGAAMISVANAPAARADDPYTGILSYITADFTAGQADFTTAFADFGQGLTGVGPGLTALFEGLDDELLGPAYDLQVGLTDVAYNHALFPVNDFIFTFADPKSFANAVTEAQAIYVIGNADLTTSAVDAGMGNYADAALFHAIGILDTSLIPDEVEIIGQIETFLATLGMPI